MRLSRSSAGARAGFTLAEAAVTIALVAITLTMVMQALETAKLKAAHTQNQKTARELGMMTLGAIETGKWWDDIDTGRSGSYADQEYSDFFYELALGDETFLELEDQGPRRFDNWAYQRELEMEREYQSQSAGESGEEEDETVEPYEQVRIRVTFPKLREFDNEVTLERWIAWEQVYGPEEDAEAEGAGDPGAAGGAGGGGGGGEAGGAGGMGGAGGGREGK